MSRHVPRQPSPPPHLLPPQQQFLNGHPTTPISNGLSPSLIPNGLSTTPSSSSSSSLPPVLQKLASANEQTWLLIGRVAEQMGDLEHALSAYENALRHNPMSLSGLTLVAGIARIKENYPKAVEYFQRVLSMQEDNGEVWSALGHCYLMQDDLQKAYSAYQQALYLLPNPKEDPKLWYGIGILYDRYGSLDHAEEAFSSVLRMDKDFDKANEILFRLGIIYKQQGKYEDSLTCFDRILRSPPSPLAHADIWFQIGHVYEQQKDHTRAKDAYERVVADNSGHAKVLQQLGWLYHQDDSSFQNQDLAIQYLTKSLEAEPSDPSDAQSWYLLGRAYMAGQKYNKAYEAYQQAVYRDGRNPTFWCSIGVLYFQINQFRDALDAYSRAIRINPYISEVWFDLGSLYESCNNQISDAIDAYARASELDPSNVAISRRLELLKNAQVNGGQVPAAPGPQDVHPTAYASAVVPPPGMGNPLLSTRPFLRAESRGPPGHEPNGHPTLPLHHGHHLSGRSSSPAMFRGTVPPVVLDESRHPPSHTPLAPMELERPFHSRDREREREAGPPSGPNRGNVLLHHPVPQQLQLPTDELRNAPPPLPAGPGGPGPAGDIYLGRPPLRVPSTSTSPPSHHSSRGVRPSPPPPLQTFPYGHDRQFSQHAVAHGHGRPSVGPAQGPPQGPVPPQHSPTAPSRIAGGDQEMGWERERERRLSEHHPHREWERERERERDLAREKDREKEMGRDRDRDRRGGNSRHSGEFATVHPSSLPPPPPPPSQAQSHPQYYAPRSPPPVPGPGRPHSPPVHHRAHTPQMHSARSHSQTPHSHPLQTQMQNSETSPHSRGYWDAKPPVPLHTPAHARGHLPPPSAGPGVGGHASPSSGRRRYDPRMDGREYDYEYERDPRDREREVEREREREREREQRERERERENERAGDDMEVDSYHGEGSRHVAAGHGSESPRLAQTPAPVPVSDQKERRRRGAGAKEKEKEPEPVQDRPVKRERRKRATKRDRAEEQVQRTGTETPKPFGHERIPSSASFKVAAYSGTPESASSTGSGSGSANRSPTGATPRPPSRVVDEDYDEGVADALMGLANYRPGYPHGPAHSPTVSNGSRGSPRPPQSHNGSISSTRSRPSPPSAGSVASNPSAKRPLSPGPEEFGESKRSRMDGSSTNGISRRTPIPSSRPSPIPFRTQPASVSPEARHTQIPHSQGMEPMSMAPPFPPSPPLPAVLPPHPRPIGPHSTSVSAPGGNNISASGPSGSIALPPIATLSPTSTAPSPKDGDDRMQIDGGVGRSRSGSGDAEMERGGSRSISPPVRGPGAGARVLSSTSPGSNKAD